MCYRCLSISGDGWGGESRNNSSCVSVYLGEGVLEMQNFPLSWAEMCIEFDSLSESLSTMITLGFFGILKVEGGKDVVGWKEASIFLWQVNSSLVVSCEVRE